MEEEIQESVTSKPFLPLGVALVGVVIGASALFVAINSANRATSIEETYASGLEKTAAITAEMERINRKMEALDANIKDAREAPRQVEALRSNIQEAITALNGYIKTNRDLIEKNRTAINELASRSSASASRPTIVSTAPAQTSSSDAPAPTAANQSAAQKHTVKAGENFSIIAKKYGKTSADIEKANPGVDSRRLKIGQEILIP